MSLYSNNEICKGCIKSIFHNCCGNFCKCKENHEPNYIEGTCKFKELIKKQRQKKEKRKI